MENKPQNLKDFKGQKQTDNNSWPPCANNGLRNYLIGHIQKEGIAEAIASVLLDKALEGNMEAIKIIFEQTEFPISLNYYN